MVHLRFRPRLRVRELARAVDLLPLQMLFRCVNPSQRSFQGLNRSRRSPQGACSARNARRGGVGRAGLGSPLSISTLEARTSPDATHTLLDLRQQIHPGIPPQRLQINNDGAVAPPVQ